jgi:hypothetical protein
MRSVPSSVGVIATDYGLTVRGSNPGGTRFSASPDLSWGHPASCTMGTRSFPGVKIGRGVTLTTYPLLVPRSWKSRAVPLPNLWATTGPVTGTLCLYFGAKRDVTQTVAQTEIPEDYIMKSAVICTPHQILFG